MINPEVTEELQRRFGIEIKDQLTSAEAEISSRVKAVLKEFGLLDEDSENEKAKGSVSD